MGRPPKGKVIWADRVLRIVSRKTCPKCERLLTPDRFGPDTRTATGLASWCNECIAAKTRDAKETWTQERWEQHNNKSAARNRRWRELQAHPDRTVAAHPYGDGFDLRGNRRGPLILIREALVPGGWADRVLRIVSRKTCPKCERLLTPDRFGPDTTGLASWCNECIAAKTRDAKDNRRWRELQAHPDRIAARAKLIGRGVDAVLRALVFDLLGRECHCGATEDLTVDHVGDPTDNSLTNLQVLCRRCNSAKEESRVDYRNEFQRAVLQRFEERAAQQKPEVDP